jgi:hypothetical protein
LKRGAAVCFAISLALAAGAAGAGTVVLEQAQWWRQPIASPLAHVPSTRPPPADATWVDWAVPADRFSIDGPGAAAKGVSGPSVSWVRWRFALPPRAAGEPLALYVPVWAVEHYEWLLNGVAVAASLGPEARFRRTWNRPLLLDLPEALLRPGDNELLLATYPYR